VIDDIAKYEASKQFVKNLYDRNEGREDLKSLISIISASSHVPCIVVAFWIGELSYWHTDVIENIEVLIKAYGYKKILNKPKGSPFEEIV